MAALTIPQSYDVQYRRGGWVAICLDWGVIADEIACEAEAIHACQEHDEADREEKRAAAENAAEGIGDLRRAA